MRLGRRSRLKPWLALVLVAASLTAVADVPSPGLDEDRVDRAVVGDLKLADDDEGPSDGVEGTFVARNLAPGDRHAAELELSRASETGLAPAFEPRVRLTFATEGSDEWAQALAVDELRYGDASLLAEARRGCGEPLTFARLAACTQADEHPLAELEDPTPEGRVFGLGVVVDPAADRGLQGSEVAFSLEAELYASSPVPEEPSRCEAALASLDPVAAPVELVDRHAEPLLSGAERGPPAVGSVLLAAQLPSTC